MKTRSLDEAAPYRIRVEGRLGEEWSARLGDLTLVVHEEAGRMVATDLTGWVADQAALMGVLDQLYSRGATLLSVERLKADVDAGEQDIDESDRRKEQKRRAER